MKRVPLNASITPEDREMVEALNQRIEDETNMKYGLSLIISSLIGTLRRKPTLEKIAADVIARKRNHISIMAIKAAERTVQRLKAKNKQR